MLSGWLEVALGPIMARGEVGCGLWVEPGLGAALCGVELDGLVDIGTAVGIVVVDGEYIDVDKWVVVELTS